MTLDVEALKEACEMGQYRTKKGATRYGHLVINIEPSEYGCLCGERSFDFSFDSNGDISVNVRKYARRNIKDFLLTNYGDWKGFLICGKTGELKRCRPSKWEPPKKFSMARFLYDTLCDYMEEL